MQMEYIRYFSQCIQYTILLSFELGSLAFERTFTGYYRQLFAHLNVQSRVEYFSQCTKYSYMHRF